MHIYGVHPSEELLRTAPDQIYEIYAADPYASKLEDVREMVKTLGLRLQQASYDELDRMAEGGNHQGIVIQTRPFEYVALGDLLDATADASRACVLVLDQIQDPHNLGAILRSSAAMGVDGVIIPKDRAAGVTAAVVRASAGQALRVPVARITNIARTLDELKEHGWWTAGAMLGEHTTDLWDMDFEMKTALVMGSEHQGIRRLVGEKCDFKVRIPMAAGVESLNVASAASIMLYEVRRQWATGGSQEG
ncbi:23S rRNA (guanosine(2251)-2'-O)-methyltransferase RlmB [Persicimonas caeni]|uniref:23S rRNA (Guanosine(2251)-2'-O)-methyltransferase RlmB n=1 Tax=Persicimonas caeni TaxID=2292766 RepID=A0A4Y6PWJ1_PERCE|nr:23S rRNA (guanosine(2251)-2'-O)-methyltransferase RlmB [Persicimonas caeni]QDG52499.1 23S rRNA (guanosine(2251)-2'-O)-methyltransferase RlmB [Persicimonas caeni]QED33721.1 23S rRNA (guanosine(2251)-2'-O)-methyltransferase RlmB [Persicimonas caeni]